MSWSLFLDILLDSLKDSALIFLFVFLLHFLLSFIDNQLSSFLAKRKKSGVIFGSLFGLIPQCGTSIIGADLYIRKYISIGVLGAIFLSCSDEALIVMMASSSKNIVNGLLLIGLKFVCGVIFGFLIDLLMKKENKKEEEYEENLTCHEHHHEQTFAHKHFIHPLLHSLEIFAYVFAISLLIGVIIGFVGEENFANFMTSSKYFSPILSSIIGLIPNCASSVLITELFIDGHLSFGALMSGLLVNSGLGMLVVLKSKAHIKKGLLLLLSMFIFSIMVGYIICLITSF